MLLVIILQHNVKAWYIIEIITTKYCVIVTEFIIVPLETLYMLAHGENF